MGRYFSMLGECTESLQMKVDCIHHWEIAAANGPSSVGICKHCLESKEFDNSVFIPMNHITLEKDTNATLEEEEKRRKSWNAY